MWDEELVNVGGTGLEGGEGGFRWKESRRNRIARSGQVRNTSKAASTLKIPGPGQLSSHLPGHFPGPGPVLFSS